MALVHSIPSIDEQFEFTLQAKTKLIIGAAIGVVSVISGIFLITWSLATQLTKANLIAKNHPIAGRIVASLDYLIFLCWLCTSFRN